MIDMKGRLKVMPRLRLLKTPPPCFRHCAGCDEPVDMANSHAIEDSTGYVFCVGCAFNTHDVTTADTAVMTPEQLEAHGAYLEAQRSNAQADADDRRYMRMESGGW